MELKQQIEHLKRVNKDSEKKITPTEMMHLQSVCDKIRHNLKLLLSENILDKLLTQPEYKENLRGAFDDTKKGIIRAALEDVDYFQQMAEGYAKIKK